MRNLKFTKTKLISVNVFIEDHLALGGKKYQNLKKEPFFGAVRGVLTCLLASERHIYVFFRTHLVSAIFAHFLSLLKIEVKLIEFSTKFQAKRVLLLSSDCTSLLLRSKPVQPNCCIFKKVLKHIAPFKS